MSGRSTYVASAQAAWFKGTAMPTPPSAVYASFFNGDPTDAGIGGTEITGQIHPAGRVAVTFGTFANKQMTDSAQVSFGNSASSSNLTASHYALWDSATVGSGNLLDSAAITGGPITIASGSNVYIAAGALTLNF